MYTTEQKIENLLMVEIDHTFSSQVADWISGVETYINNYCNKPDGFEESTSASAKYFDGNGTSEIDIDDFTEITSVEILEANGADVEWSLTEGLNDDYVEYPYNTTPKYRLILTTNRTVGAWYKGDKRIKVTAKWGHSTSVPKDIELVATQLVGNIVEKGMKGGKIQAESLGDYSVTFAKIDEEAQAMGITKILDHYKIFKV